MNIYKIEVTETKPATYDITGTPTGDTNASVTFKDADGKAITEAAAGTVVTVVAEGTGKYVPATYSTDDADTAVTEGKFTMPAKNITVTVNFEEQSSEALFAAAREKLTAAVLSYTVAQADANTEADVKANVAAKLAEALSGTGVTAKVTTTAFNAATGSADMDATAENNGSYTYTVALKVGEETEGEGAEAINGTVTIEATTKAYTQDTLGAVVSAAKAKLLAYGAGETAADVFTGHIVVEPATMKALTDAMSAAQVVVNQKTNATEADLKAQTKALTQAVAAFEAAVEGKTEEGTKTDAGLKVLTADAYSASSDTADGYFTVSVPPVSESGAGVFSDGYAAGTKGSGGKRFPMADASTIKFTVTAGSTADVRVYWVCNDNTAGVTLTPATGTTAGGQSSGVTKNFPAIATWSGLPGGTEYTIKGKQYIFRVEVKETAPAQASKADVIAMPGALYDTISWAGKPALADMQDGVTFTPDASDATTIKVAGTLKYVENFTGFDGADTTAQKGNYVALQIKPDAATAGALTAESPASVVTVPEKGALTKAVTLTGAADQRTVELLLRVSSKKQISFKVDWDGEGEAYTETTYTLDFTGNDLILGKPATATPTFAANGGEYQVTSKTDNTVSFTVSNSAADIDYKLYKIEGEGENATRTQLGGNDAVKADENGVITFHLGEGEQVSVATADSTDTYTRYITATKDGSDESQAAAVSVKAYIPVATIELTHFTPDGAGGDISGTVNHVLYEKMNEGDADVIGSALNPDPDHPNGWKLAPVVKGPGDKTPTNPAVTFSNLKNTPEFISVDPDGTVKALKAGTGRVRVASVADPDVYVGFNMTVKVRIGGITLKKGEDTVNGTLNANMGDELDLGAEVATSAGGKNADGSNNNTYQAVTWSSSDTDVAEVAANGAVTLKKVGNTTITATSAVDNTVSASVTLTVAAGTPTLTLTAGNAQVTSGGTVRFKLTGVPEGVTPTFTVKKNGTEDNEVSVVALADDPDYNYKAVMPTNETGASVAYEITAAVAASDNWGAAESDAVTVTVQDAAKKNIFISKPGATGTANVTVGGSATLTVEAQVNGAGQLKDEALSAALTYAWSKGEDAIADANTANYAIPAADLAAAGTLTYKCTISSADTDVDPQSVTVTFTVTVADPELASIDVALTAAEGLTYTDGSLAIVGPVPAEFTITTAPDGHKDTVKSTVSAADTAIVGAVVEGNKLTITPKAPGTATVTLAGETAHDVTKVISVTVTKAPAPAALTENDYTVTQPTAAGGKGTITITQTPAAADGYVYRLGDSGDWTQFPEGNSVQLDPGTYKIRVRVANPALQETTNGVAVTINEYQAPVTVTDVEIESAADTVAVEGTLQLTAKITTSDNKVNTATADDVTWSAGSANATVSTTGLVTGVSEGTVVITATSKKDASKSATKTITVTAKPTTKYNVTVTGGSADKVTAAAGETVTVTAAAAPAGKVFDKWTATGITLSAEDAGKASLTFTMPANVVALTATYKDAGTNPPTDVDKTELTAKYDEVKAAVEAATVAADGSNVDPDAQWITEANKALADTALGEVKAVLDNAEATADDVTAAMGKLDTVEGYLQAGTKTDVPTVDKTELTAAIEAAEAKYEGVVESANGEDVLTTDKWMVKADLDAAKAAIAEAKKVLNKANATQTEVDEAKTALAAALAELSEPASGTKAVTIDDLAAAIATAKKAAEAIKVDTDAKNVKKGTKWVTAEVKAAYEAAIAAAQAVADAAEPTTEQVTDALAALNTATRTFEAAQQDGTKASRPTGGGGTPGGAGVDNATNKKNETLSDGTKRVTETAKDGTVTVTDTKPDGTKSVTTTTPAGEVTTTVTLGRDVDNAQVSVPVDKAESGMVAVIVKPDGTEEIIRDSVVVDGDMVFDLDESATVKIVNNAKHFVDITGHWAKDDVDYVTARELFNGVDATHFAPDTAMTRGMMATVLFRLDGETKSGKNVDFSDVAAGDWFAAAVDWAAEQGVITGYTDGSFGPNRAITREELVVMVYRYAGVPAVDGKDLNGFTDADQVADWATAAMTWAIQNKIVQGKGNDVLDPKGNATRAEVSAVLQRYVRLSK